MPAQRSRYFPWLRKRPGLSGYRTVAASLHDHVASNGPPTGEWLRGLDTATCAGVFGQL